jgi:ELWxxDGT repeat protein
MFRRGSNRGARIEPKPAIRRAIESLEQRLMFYVYDGPLRELTEGPGGLLLFVNDDGIHGPELWKSDGTPEGTVLLKDVDAGPAGSEPGELVTIGGFTYFTADDFVHGRELWRTDGTRAGTVMVKDLDPGEAASNPGHLAALNGSLLFDAFDGFSQKVWRTDGTAAGTVPLMEGWLSELTVAGNRGYFLGNQTNSNAQTLWQTDGTSEGTGRAGPEPDYDLANTPLYALGDKIVFMEESQREVWKYDPATGSTTRIHDFANNATVKPHGVVGSRLLFTVYPPSDENWDTRELWATDGTPGGMKKIWAGQEESSWFAEHEFARVGNQMFFSARDLEVEDGLALWKTDGTAAGTRLVKDESFVTPGYLTELTAVGGVLYFFDNERLWRSDDTAAGTKLVAGMRPMHSLDGAGGVELAEAGGRLYFVGFDSYRGYDLWTQGPAPTDKPRQLRTIRAPIYLKRGVLYVGGTSFNDKILINAAGTGASATITVAWNRLPAATFKASDVRAISVRTLEGDDIVRLTGRLPQTTVDGGDDDDSLAGGDGPSLLVGGIGDDTLVGGTGHERLWGGHDDDSITGGKGNDNLRGDAGNDYLEGGAGADAFSGGDGDDLLDYTDRTQNLSISLDGVRNDGAAGELDMIGDVETVLGGWGNDSIIGSFRNDDLRGGGGHDTIRGNGGADTLDGADGDDALFGGDGDDVVMGGRGTDTLHGDLGNDGLGGGDGRDWILGGSGNDTLSGNFDSDAPDELLGGKGRDSAYADTRDRRSQVELLLESF